jgi:Ring finger domain
VGSSSSFLSIDWGDNEECPICRKPLGLKSVAMPDCCSHFFCYACIKSWVTKSKSNCPMDRMDISQLKIFDNSGKFKRTEKVEAKEQEDDVEFDLDDEGICPVSESQNQSCRNSFDVIYLVNI